MTNTIHVKTDKNVALDVLHIHIGPCDIIMSTKALRIITFTLVSIRVFKSFSHFFKIW